MVSPSSLPLYLIVISLPLNSRVTWNETLPSFSTLPSLMSASPPKDSSLPVSFSPSCLTLSVLVTSSPFCRWNFQVQVPVASTFLSSAREAPTNPAARPRATRPATNRVRVPIERTP